MLRVTEALDVLGIPYLVGGSVASIIHGFVRTTADVDLVVDIRSNQAAPLVRLLQGEFLIAVEPILQAIRHQRSFQLLHEASFLRIDIFVSKQRPFDHERFRRREELTVAREPTREAWISSAEDTILAKLEWFKIGGETSERQWRDILGVIKTQAEALDVGYLRRWAPSLDVDILLERALEEGHKKE